MMSNNIYVDSVPSLDGWLVKWNNSFRDYIGICIKTVCDSPEGIAVVVYDFISGEEFRLSFSPGILRKVRPAALEFANYWRSKFLETEPLSIAIHDRILENLIYLKKQGNVSTEFKAAVSNAIETEHKLRKKTLREEIAKRKEEVHQVSIKQDLMITESQTGDDSNDDESIQEDCEIEKETITENEKGAEEIASSDENCEQVEDDIDDNDEDEESEQEESEVEESEEEESEEEDEGEGEDGDDDDSDDNDSEENDGRESVDVKVYIRPNSLSNEQDIRGFCIAINANGLKRIQRTLLKDYKTQFDISYHEADGDIINIKSSDDLKYAYRSERQQASAKQSKGKGKGKSTKPRNSHYAVKLKLFAIAVKTGKNLASSGSADSHTIPGQLPSSQNIDSANPSSTATTIRITANGSHIHEAQATQILSPLALSLLPSPSQSLSASNSNRTLFKDRFKSTHFSESSLVADSLGASIATASTAIAGPGLLYNYEDMRNSRSHRLPTVSLLDHHNAEDYEVIWKRGELLGRGSFGQVYSGINLTNGERMAVKEVILYPGKRQKQQAKALRQEVKILSALDHPNIVKYLGTEVRDGALRIFLELATDGTVKDALNEFGAFPEPLIRSYTVDIVEGLSFLHSKMFIHRDIKPTNLLVSRGVVKLADFGCSSQYFENDSTSNAGHGTMVGTTVYMAPEVMNCDALNISAQLLPIPKESNERASGDILPDIKTTKTRGKSVSVNSGYGKKADIWSVGMTLVEMATAQAPFSNAASAIYCIFVTKQIPRFPDIFYEDAHNFLSRCLVEQPRERANCIELRAHPFLSRQSMDVIRAQTASVFESNRQRNTASTLRVKLPSNISFLVSEERRSFTDEDGDGNLTTSKRTMQSQSYVNEALNNDRDRTGNETEIRTEESQSFHLSSPNHERHFDYSDQGNMTILRHSRREFSSHGGKEEQSEGDEIGLNVSRSMSMKDSSTFSNMFF